MQTTISTREAILEAMDADALSLYYEYRSKLASADATVEDLRKAFEMHLKRHGIGQSDKADTRVVVDIVFENGMIDTATPARIERVVNADDITDAVVKQAQEATGADLIPSVPSATPDVQKPTMDQDFDFDALLGDLTPIE